MENIGVLMADMNLHPLIFKSRLLRVPLYVGFISIICTITGLVAYNITPSAGESSLVGLLKLVIGSLLYLPFLTIAIILGYTTETIPIKPPISGDWPWRSICIISISNGMLGCVSGLIYCLAVSFFRKRFAIE